MPALCCALPGAGGHAATISRSTSSPTCAAISSRRRPALPGRRAGRAAAAVRCSTLRSTTTRRRIPPPTRAGWSSACSAGRRRSSRARSWRSRIRRAAAAATRLRPGAGRPLVGVHVSGGRAIKQWPPERFAEVAARLADTRNAVIVATGAPSDRALVSGLQAALAPRLVIDAAAEDGLLVSAAILAQARRARNRRYRPHAPGVSRRARRSSPSSGRRTRRDTRPAGRRTESSASTCRAAPATASAGRRNAVSATPRTASRASASDAVFAAATSGARSVGCSRPACAPAMTDAVFSHRVRVGTARRPPRGVSGCDGRGTRVESTRSPGSRACARPASTACGCAIDSRSAAIRCGGSRSCTCTSRGAIATIFRALAALEALVERERPQAMRFVTGGGIVQGLAPQVAAARRPPYHGPRGFRRGSAADAGSDGRACLGPDRFRARLTTALASCRHRHQARRRRWRSSTAPSGVPTPATAAPRPTSGPCSPRSSADAARTPSRT